jgi:hypothetical protein
MTQFSYTSIDGKHKVRVDDKFTVTLELICPSTLDYWWAYTYDGKEYKEKTFFELKARFEQHMNYEMRIKALEDQLHLATTFKYLVPATSRIALIEIIKQHQRDLSTKWAIVDSGYTLNKLGEWEFQSMPSSRTSEYLERNRYDSYADAVAMLDEHFKNYPTGYKDE